MQRDKEPKLFIQEVNTTASQLEIQKKFPRESSFPLGYIWVAIFVNEVTKGHIKSITKKSLCGRERRRHESFGLTKYVFVPMLYTTTSCKEGWQKRAPESKPLKSTGSFSVIFAVVKAPSPAKSECLKCSKTLFH